MTGKVDFKYSKKELANQYIRRGTFNITIRDADLYINELKIDEKAYPRISQRNIDIVKLRILNKISYEEIGQLYNLSKQRIHQIYNQSLYNMKLRYFNYLMRGG